MENRNPPEEGRRNYDPNRSNAAERRKKIQGPRRNDKTLTDYNNGTEKIKFIVHTTYKAEMDIEIPNAAKDEKKKGKYIVTIAVETALQN